MTGFADVTDGDLTFTLKAVNHRALDLHFHMPPQFEPQEARLRTLLTGNIRRGSVQIRVSQNSNTAALTLNRPLLQAWLREFRAVAAELDLPEAQPDLNQALRMPGIFQPQTAAAPPDLIPPAVRALGIFNEFREREGAAIDAELTARTHTIAALAAQIAQIRTTAAAAFHQRLTTRLAELLGSAVDPQRLVQEAAMLADRSDISEELVRLQHPRRAARSRCLRIPEKKEKSSISFFRK